MPIDCDSAVDSKCAAPMSRSESIWNWTSDFASLRTHHTHFFFLKHFFFQLYLYNGASSIATLHAVLIIIAHCPLLRIANYDKSTMNRCQVQINVLFNFHFLLTIWIIKITFFPFPFLFRFEKNSDTTERFFILILHPSTSWFFGALDLKINK